MTKKPSAPSIKEVISFRHSVAPPFSVIPLLLETKLPAVQWKSVIDGEPFDDQELRGHWARFKGRVNPGMATGRFCAGGIVAVDLDNAAAVEWARAKLPATRMRTVTRAGEHWFYRIAGGSAAERVPNMADVLGSKARWEWEAETKLGLKIKAKQAKGQSNADFEKAVKAASEAKAEAEQKLEMGPIIDVRGDGGQVVAPGAIHPSGFVYAMAEPWTQEVLDSIPVFDGTWFEGVKWRRPDRVGGPVSLDTLKNKKVEERIEAARTTVTPDQKLKRAGAWILKADPSVSGQGGHNQAFYVACRLVCGFLLTVDDAYHLMKRSWNDSCQPPWSDEELAHKVIDAEKQRGQNDGFMLVDRPEYLAKRKVKDLSPPLPTSVQESQEMLDDEEAIWEQMDDDEGTSEAQGDGGNGASPPSGGDGGGGDGGGGEGGQQPPPPTPADDDDRMWQKRWQKPFRVNYLRDIKGKTLWTPRLGANNIWQIPPWPNNIAAVIGYSRVFSKYTIRFNNLKMYPEINDERLDDGWELRLKSTLDDMFRANIPIDHIRQAILLTAHNNAYEPVQDWITNLVWDGVPRLANVPKTYLGSIENPMISTMFRHTMIGMAARIMVPGTKVDHITFLVGPQGAKKSSFWRLLIDGDLKGNKWFTDAPFNLNDKDGRMLIGTNVVVEWSEGEHAKSDLKIDRVKGFLSAQEDEFRPPYGHNLVKRSRRCIFVGTSNDDELLHDPTGNRRFYIIKTGRHVDVDGMLDVRDQLFAEALHEYKRHMAATKGSDEWHETRWWFEAEEDRMRELAVKEFQARSTWHEDIAHWMELRVKEPQPEFTIGEVIEHCVKMPRERKSKRVENDVRKTLIALGAKCLGNRRVGGRQGRFWMPPSAEGEDDDLPM